MAPLTHFSCCTAGAYKLNNGSTLHIKRHLLPRGGWLEGDKRSILRMEWPFGRGLIGPKKNLRAGSGSSRRAVRLRVRHG